MAHSGNDSLALLQAENARLVTLLESHGIEWRIPPAEPRLPVAAKLSVSSVHASAVKYVFAVAVAMVSSVPISLAQAVVRLTRHDCDCEAVSR